VRLIEPSDNTNSGVNLDWQPIVRRQFSGEELLQYAAQFPRYLMEREEQSLEESVMRESFHDPSAKVRLIGFASIVCDAARRFAAPPRPAPPHRDGGSSLYHHRRHMQPPECETPMMNPIPAPARRG
jgi:hypothetical protein